MPLQDKQLKDTIAHSWDEASLDYDKCEGHGIKSPDERSAWKQLAADSFPKGTRSVIDVGCGTGELCLLFAEMGYQVTGIDISEKMLDAARAKARARNLAIDYRSGDAENPPFPDGTFDVVFSRHLLWTLPHPQEALNGWHRVLKKGGRAVVVDGVWDDGSLNTRIKRSAADWGTRIFEGKQPHKGHYSTELRAELPNAGGAPRERTTDYLSKAGFNNISFTDIRHIREIQAKQMSLWGRLRRSHYYYLISGEI